MHIEEIGRLVIHAAIRVHSELGPGLLESAYQACLEFELRKSGLDVASEVCLPVMYKGMKIDAGYRLDLLINDAVIVENKCVEKLLPIHEAQLLTYMKLNGAKLGYLLNWNVTLMKDGIKRMVLNL
jgi:GxxExxY protein